MKTRQHNKNQWKERRLGMNIIVLLLVTCSMLGITKRTAGNERVLTFALIEFAPYGFLTQDGKITGTTYEWAIWLAEQAGLTFEIELVPFPRAIAMIESGEADLTSMYPNEKIEEAAIPIAINSIQRNIIVGRAGSQFASLDELRGKEVANIRGARYHEEYDTDPAIEKYEVTNYAQGLKMVLSERLDAVVGTEIGLYYVMKQEGLSRDQFGEPLVLETRNSYLFFSKKTVNEAMIEVLRPIVEQGIKDGVGAEITARFFR